MEILLFIILLAVGCIIGWLYAKSKIQLQQHQIDLDYQQQKEQIKLDFNDFKSSIELERQNLITELNSLTQQKKEMNSSLENLREQAEQASQIFYDKSMDLARAQIEKDIDYEEEKYAQASKDAKEEYEEILSNLTNNVQRITKNYQEASKNLARTCTSIDTIVEALKLMEKERTEKDFNRCIISEQDQEEIQKIRSIAPYLRDPAPLNKIIWKVYYEKPANAMLGRVLGADQKTGIYKITNIENGMCYVGQAISIQSRWIQHIKRGLGAEAPTRNKLYPAMYEIGVENFTFELLEECSPEELNEREDYYQEIFHAKDYGYSIK